MPNRTEWTAGNGAGLTWTAAFNSSDLVSLPNGSGVRSTVADIANGTNLDMFMDISMSLAIASSTIAVGANISFWIYALNEDGSTYGDGAFGTAGSQGTVTPTFGPCAIMPIPPVAATTSLVGIQTQIMIPPGSFRLVAFNTCGFALSAGTQTVKYRTYNINLNN